MVYPPGGQAGRVPSDFRPRGQSCKSPPSTFLTLNNAIAGSTNQSLGLPAYACKTDSSTAIKLASRMHQNLPFELKNLKTFLGRRHSHLPTPVSRWGGEHFLLTLHPLCLGAFGASFLALAMIRPPHFKPWIRPWQCRQLPSLGQWPKILYTFLGGRLT